MVVAIPTPYSTCAYSLILISRLVLRRLLLLFGATFGFFYLGMQYMQLIRGYSALRTAIAFSPFIILLGLLSALSFWHLPKLGLRLVVTIGLGIMALGVLGMVRLDRDSSYYEITWNEIILRTGIGFWTAPTTSVIMRSVPEPKQGVASAVNDTAREVGAALGLSPHDLKTAPCSRYVVVEADRAHLASLRLSGQARLRRPQEHLQPPGLVARIRAESAIPVVRQYVAPQSVIGFKSVGSAGRDSPISG